MVVACYERLAKGNRTVLSACFAAAVVGLVIGLKFRVAMLLAAALMTSLASIAVAIHLGWSGPRTISVLAVLLAVQQGFYVVGLFTLPRR
jgi:hypothetical protein